MERQTGTYTNTTAAGERVPAFIPHALPPVPPVLLDGALAERLEAATLALGRLDGISALLPDVGLFLYAYVRKEAVLSSAIEGTVSSLSDLLLFERDEAPGVPVEDAAEVSHYVAALEHATEMQRSGMPIANRMLRETHRILLSHSRGAGKAPGEYRRSQNWLGGTRPGNASFVPPPHTAVPDCMAALERFVNARADGVPALLRAGMVHVQFETVHPFLDGNGRLGRMLVPLMLCDAGMIQAPLLYLSLYLKRHRTRYYSLLDAVRRQGDWEAWLAFFLDGVRETANEAVDAAQRSRALFAQDRDRIVATGQRTGSTLRVFDALRERPILTIADACRATSLTFPTVSAAMRLLTSLEIATELPRGRRARLFCYRDYLQLLQEE